MAEDSSQYPSFMDRQWDRLKQWGLKKLAGALGVEEQPSQNTPPASSGTGNTEQSTTTTPKDGTTTQTKAGASPSQGTTPTTTDSPPSNTPTGTGQTEEKPTLGGVLGKAARKYLPDGVAALLGYGGDDKESSKDGDSGGLFGGGGILGGIGGFLKNALMLVVAIVAAVVMGIGKMLGGVFDFFGGGNKSSEHGGVASQGGGSSPQRDGATNKSQSRGGLLGVVDTAVEYATSGWNRAKDFVNGLPGGYHNAIDYFESQGWTKEQASGVVANLAAESKLNPRAVGDSGQAKGIGQWHPDRQQEFEKLYGHKIDARNISDSQLLKEQLAFVQYELTQGNEQAAGARLKQAKTAAEAGAVVSTHYERPAAQQQEANHRAKDAEQIYAAALKRGTRGGSTPSADGETVASITPPPPSPAGIGAERKVANGVV